MPYIDVAYYVDVFKGSSNIPSQELEKAILRASEIIDVITNYALVNTNTGESKIDSQNQFVQNQIKKATSVLVEHYILQGGYDATRQVDVQSADIGDFRFSAKDIEEVPENVFAYLKNTGLLYSGIRVERGLNYPLNGWWT